MFFFLTVYAVKGVLSLEHKIWRFKGKRGLNVYFQKENLNIFDEQGKEHPFLTIFIAILGTVAQMERDNIKFRLDSGRELYKRSGGKLGERPATANRKSRNRNSMPE